MSSEALSFEPCRIAAVPAPVRRVLVVEDEAAIAIMIERRLQELGYTVVGPVSKLADAIRLALSDGFDAAVLDVAVRGGDVYPVAETLLARGIPFLLASGYSEWALPKALAGRPRLTKPFRLGEFDEQIAKLFER